MSYLLTYLPLFTYVVSNYLFTYHLPTYTIIIYGFLLGFLNKKKFQSDNVKKTTLLIWTSSFIHVQWNQAVKLDLVILIKGMTDKMIDHLASW
jgi:hypothetical protein